VSFPIENRNFFQRPLTQFLLELCNSGSAKKTRIIPLPEGGKSLAIGALFSLQHRSVTDGRNCHNNIELCMYNILTRDIKRELQYAVVSYITEALSNQALSRKHDRKTV